MSVYDATGDLFDPETWTTFGKFTEIPVDVIGHGVNCKGVMGSGIAVAFRTAYPAMYEDYRDRCLRGYLKPGEVFVWPNPFGTTIFNIASQFNPGANADLDFLEMGLLYSRFVMKKNGLKHLALPRIGAGIGGLDWDDVQDVVYTLFRTEPNLHVTLVSLEDA